MATTNITQPSFSSGIISTELFSRIDFSKLTSGLKNCENFVIRPAGGATFRVGTKYIAETKHKNKRVALLPFVYNRKNSFCLEFGDKYIRFFKDGFPVMKDEAVYEVETTYEESELSEIKYTQDRNKMFLVHPNHPPALLERKDDNDWVLRDLVFNPAVAKVTEVKIEKQTADKTDEVVDFDGWKYAVAVVNKDGLEGLPVYSNTITSDIDLLNQPIKVTFKVNKEDTDIKEFRVYRIKGGEFFQCYILDYTGNEEYSFKDLSFALDETVTPKEMFTEFEDGNYPSSVGYWNQRLILGGTKKKVNTFWGSRVAEPEDFAETLIKSADGPFELTFNSGTFDAITDFIPLDDLIVFTESKVWRVSGTSPGNMVAYIESYSGSSGLRPFASKKSVLYVDSSLNTISNFVYSYELNGYSGQDLDILSRGLFDGYSIRDISYKDNPYGVLYCVRNDGVLLGLTYLREENIYAWHQHKTQGLFKNICAVEGTATDLVYCVVERDGVSYIELFGNYINETDDINDSWHLDCATKYRSSVYSYQNKKEVADPYEEQVFESSKVGPQTFMVERNGWYDITLVGGGGGGSNPAGGAGGGVTLKAKLLAGEYTINIGKGGAGAGAYVRNNNGHVGDSSSMKGEGFSLVCKGGTQGYGRRNGGKPGTIGAVEIDSDRDFEIIKRNKAGETSNKSFITDDVNGAGAGGVPQGNDEGAGYAGKGGYCKIIMHGENYSYVPGDLLYTEGEPVVGGNAYYNIDLSNVETITEVGDDYIKAGGDTYYIKSKESNIYDKVTGLERFNGKTICAVVDTNFYDNLYVENGETYLPYTSSSVLVGLPYEGYIETIPGENKYSSGNSTVGVNRKINDGILTYYRSRGLWYGKDKDKLYEIKPYTQASYGENIPLETGKLNLKVSDGFSMETSFVVAQKSPFPALIQSITLGSTYNGKN